MKRLADPSVKIDLGIDELLRLSSPISYVARRATRDLEIEGANIAEGDRVLCFFTSANRDEWVFDSLDSLDSLDLERRPNPHVALGAGPHRCPGATLVRAVLRGVLDQIAGDLASLVLAAPVVWKASPTPAGPIAVLTRIR